MSVIIVIHYLEDGRHLARLRRRRRAYAPTSLAIPLAMITMRNSTHEFPSVFDMGMGSAISVDDVRGLTNGDGSPRSVTNRHQFWIRYGSVILDNRALLSVFIIV